MPPRYSLEPLAEALGCTLAQLGRRLGVSGSTWKQYRDVGVSELVADRLAVSAGLHPFVVWPELVEFAITEVDDIDYEIAKNRDDRRRQRQAAWAKQNRQSNPDARARQIAYSATYRAAYREASRAYRRRYYRANRERELARQREYDARRRQKLSHPSAMVA